MIPDVGLRTPSVISAGLPVYGLLEHSPQAEVLIALESGRVVEANDIFCQEFNVRLPFALPEKNREPNVSPSGILS